MLLLSAIYHLINAIRKKETLSAFLLIIACQAAGQTTSFMPLTRLSVANGLSSSNIRKIVQDKYGFIWISTQDGLNRFEGKQIEILNAGSNKQWRNLPGQDIYDIGLDPSGDYLWALIPYAGISKINLQTVSVAKNYLKIHGNDQPNYWYKCMAQKDQLLYIGTNEGFVFGFDTKEEKKSFQLHIRDLFGQDYPIDKIKIGVNGFLYLFLSGKGILVYDPAQKAIIKLIGIADLYLNSNFQFTDVVLHAGMFWISTSMGLRCVAAGNYQVMHPRKLQTTPSLWFLNRYLSTLSVYNGQVMYSSTDGLFQTDTALDQPVQILPTRNYEYRDLFELANCIHQQGQVVWVGSQYGLAWIKDRFSPFMALTNSLNGNGNRIRHSQGLLPLSDSVMAVCSDDALYFANHRTGAISRFSDDDFYVTAFKAPGNLFIASGDQGFRLFNESGESLPLNKYFPELSGIRHDLLIGATAFADSLIFMASQNQNGLYKWNYLTKTVTTISTNSAGIQLQSNVINKLYVDARKNLWILCDNVISQLDVRTNTVRHITIKDTTRKKPMSVFMDICEIAGHYWMAVYGTGIVCLDQNLRTSKIFTLHHGINNLGLYKVMKLSDSSLIASTNNGLSLVNLQSGKVSNFFEEDGLHSSSFEEISGAFSDGYIFLGGFNGLTRIDPKKLRSSPVTPLLYFSNATIRTENGVKDTMHIFMHSLTIPNDATQVIIHFSALNFTSPEKIKYQYRLLPISKQWESGGLEPLLNLVGIEPGKYALQVRASGEDGSWSEPIHMTLDFLPKWYQTWWFKVLVIFLSLTIILVLVRMRLHQLSREEAIRKKLSNDLHDDLGGTLNSVKVHANLAMLDPGNGLHLQRIKDSTQQAIVSTRDLIWVLDDKKDTIDHLVSRLMQFAEPLCDAKDISFTREISNDAWNVKLGKEEKRNLYMILKESITNSIKYSQCKSIRLQIKLEGKNLALTTSDDGIGYDQQTVTPGNGIANIFSRAREAGYEAKIFTAPGKGTIVQLSGQ